jgi:hypothetical protein
MDRSYTGDTKVEVELKTNNDNRYTLRIYIGNCPNSIPEMFVVSSPKPMPDWENSSVTHTLSKLETRWVFTNLSLAQQSLDGSHPIA